MQDQIDKQKKEKGGTEEEEEILSIGYVLRILWRVLDVTSRLFCWLVMWRIVGGTWVLSFVIFEIFYYFMIYHITHHLIVFEAITCFVVEFSHIPQYTKFWEFYDDYSPHNTVAQLISCALYVIFVSTVFAVSLSTNSIDDSFTLHLFDTSAFAIHWFVILSVFVAMYLGPYIIPFVYKTIILRNGCQIIHYSWFNATLLILMKYTCVFLVFSLTGWIGISCAVFVDLIIYLSFIFCINSKDSEEYKNPLHLLATLFLWIFPLNVIYNSSSAFSDTGILFNLTFWFRVIMSYLYNIILVFFFFYDNWNGLYANSFENTRQYFVNDNIMLGLVIYVEILGVLLPFLTFGIISSQMITQTGTTDRGLDKIVQSGDIYGLIDLMEFGVAPENTNVAIDVNDMAVNVNTVNNMIDLNENKNKSEVKVDIEEKKENGINGGDVSAVSDKNEMVITYFFNKIINEKSFISIIFGNLPFFEQFEVMNYLYNTFNMRLTYESQWLFTSQLISKHLKYAIYKLSNAAELVKLWNVLDDGYIFVICDKIIEDRIFEKASIEPTLLLDIRNRKSVISEKFSEKNTINSREVESWLNFFLSNYISDRDIDMNIFFANSNYNYSQSRFKYDPLKLDDLFVNVLKCWEKSFLAIANDDAMKDKNDGKKMIISTLKQFKKDSLNLYSETVQELFRKIVKENNDIENVDKCFDNSDEIRMYKEQVGMKRKILLLGAGEVGKSTICRQIRYIYGEPFSEAEKLAKKAMLSIVKYQDIHKYIYNVTSILQLKL